MEQLTPLMPDAPAERLERVAAIKRKAGRSGEFVIVTLETNYSQHGQLCIREERDIVYRDAPRNDARNSLQDEKKRPPPAASLALDLIPDPVLLFRFSALTFNSHRIHYDREYAMSTEGYSDLVVHGPLSAVLLAELVRKHSKVPIRDFSFRAVRPLFANRPLHLRGEFHDGSFALAAYDDHGFLAVEAQAGLGAP
ncbi:hypothetical protein [Nitratireductor sp. XY-223]|uniref:hypothetical protein n=1 Tax=Nitratireductor sp. XY-223 TaxID=2561926 RepID=UPI0010AA579A|nr:hypothetical protein [Nitratireductor sp. XY-223]